MFENLQTWDLLMKKIVWRQLGKIENKNILDFGSGIGATACYLADKNNVTAIEPDINSVNKRFTENDYIQLVGSLDVLKNLDSEIFDMIICHNVLEYADNREEIVGEFRRVLKHGGKLSIVKHNRFGRVMQMIVLLNDFDTAGKILDGENSRSVNFGTINYYDSSDIIKWCSTFSLTNIYGIRTFWDLQQNQDIQKNPDWQEKMIDFEMRVSQIDQFRDIAFFHHLIFEKT